MTRANSTPDLLQKSSASIGEALTAVVVSHDSARVLISCLSSLAEANAPVILIDNASNDASATIGEAFGARVLRNPRNEGFGRAMNLGVQIAQTPFVLLVNPDLTLEPGAVRRLLEAANRYENAAILAPRITEPDGRISFSNRSLLAPYLKNTAGVKWAPEGDCCTPFLAGACWLVRREAILSLGGFDPEIFLFYEDDDLCRRVIDAGYSVVHVHDAIALHERGASSAPAPGRAFKARFHLAWSRLYVSKKWGVSENPWPWAIRAGFKFLFAAAILNRKRMERYWGTIAGFIAQQRGERALAREGLIAYPKPRPAIAVSLQPDSKPL